MNRNVGCFDPNTENSFSVSVYIMAVHSLKSVQSLSSTCVTKFEFADIRFILFVPLCDCKSTSPIPKFEASNG